ncbi:MAG: aminopeptidase N [Halothiobacillaceae bacterium]|nr:MAG: aminopeptidase N [Halothiobacillaceae bacterium]
MSTENRTVRLADYTAPAWRIPRIELTFELDPESTLVHGVLHLERAGDAALPLKLDGEALELLRIAIDDQPLAGEAHALTADGGLIIHNPPARFVLSMTTRITPSANTTCMGLYLSKGIFTTQCEPEGFRRMMYSLDRPDVLSVHSTRIVADPARYPVMLSNGNRVDETTLEDGRRQSTWHDPFPKPTYLYALVAGELGVLRDRFVTMSGREVGLEIYAEHHNVDKLGHAMQSVHKAMKWDEATYGREYDLERYMIVTVEDFNAGAMENKGLNIFNAKYVLARPEVATDADYEGIESVIAHEYFHNWSGNRVTCRDWFQLSLKEGFTVFRDQAFSADMGARACRRIEDVNILRSWQFPEDAGPLAHPVQPPEYQAIDNFYTTTVYNKGAEVVRMLKNLLGWEAFRKGSDLYFERHDGQAVTIEEFVRAMEDASGKDLTQFRRWYVQAGTPRVEASGAYDAAARTYTLTLRQHTPATPGQPDKQPFVIPVAAALLDRSGRTLTEQVLELDRAEQRFVFEDIAEAPLPSLLRGFSAPVKLDFDYGDADLAFLMAHDGDDFNRWEAAQRLMTRVLLTLVEDVKAGRELALDAGLNAAFGHALHDEPLDQRMKADLLTLPSEAWLAEQMTEVDPLAVHAARDFLKRALAEVWEEGLLTIYNLQQEQGEYSPSPAAIGRRRLKNMSLSYLMALDNSAHHALAAHQFRKGHNMTDVLAALQTLAHSACEDRAVVLAEFEQRWENEALVMDKWFSIQATSPLPGALDEVKGLMDHPAFSLGNPNKARALIGGFARGNPAGFHAEDGAGYRFVADQVLALDALNPQVSARMAGAFQQWRRFDPLRRNQMRDELSRLAGGPISRELREVVEKSLG